MKKTGRAHLFVKPAGSEGNVPESALDPETAADSGKAKHGDGSPKSWGMFMRLCLFFGWTGAHRFYTGKYVTGVLWLLTFGLFGPGWWIDCIVGVCGRFKDKNGACIKRPPVVTILDLL